MPADWIDAGRHDSFFPGAQRAGAACRLECDLTILRDAPPPEILS